MKTTLFPEIEAKQKFTLMKKHLAILSFLFSSTFLLAQSWATMAPLPGGAADARHHPVTFSSGGFGYVMGGDVNGQEENDFMRYDPTTDSWEMLPDFPGLGRSFSYGTSRDTKAYVGFGGADEVPFNDLWEYDTETETWTELATCPCEPRYHPAFIQVNDKIYVGLGNNPFNLNDWWEYDIPTNTWTEKEDLPGPTRHHPYHFAIDGIAYVGLGHGNSVNGLLSIYTDWYMFDPTTSEWTQLADFPGEARVAGTQFDHNGKGYVLSGDGDDHNFMETGEFWQYDPIFDSWVELTAHPGSSRWAPGSFVIDNYVYMIGGLSNVQLESDMLRFDLGTIVSTGNELTASTLSVYPNPARNSFSINQDITQFSEVQLVNSYGQLVRKLESEQINVESLPSGMYYLKFFKGESIYTKKLIIID